MKTVTADARDLPQIRADLTAWLRDDGTDGAAAWLAFLLAVQEHHNPGSTGPDPTAAAARIHRRLAAAVPAAELFWVAADMTQLAHHAATTLPDYRPCPEDLPAPCGVMAFEAPPRRGTGGMPIGLVTWGPAASGVSIHYWTRTDTPKPASTRPPGPRSRDAAAWADLVRAVTSRGVAVPPHPIPATGYLYANALHVPYATPGPACPDTPPHDETGPGADAAQVMRIVVATWLLMGQTIAVHHTDQAPRATRRRVARLDPALTTAVRTVALRRARTEPSDAAPTDRVHHHRWVVAGHWRTYRDQRFSEDVRDRPIWIHPHIKGPDGAPLIGGERVHVLKR